MNLPTKNYIKKRIPWASAKTVKIRFKKLSWIWSWRRRGPSKASENRDWKIGVKLLKNI